MATEYGLYANSTKKSNSYSFSLELNGFASIVCARYFRGDLIDNGNKIQREKFRTNPAYLENTTDEENI